MIEQATLRLAPEPPGEADLDVALLADIQAYYERFVELPTHEHGLVVATWKLHTWCFEAAYVTPYLYFTSKGPGTGKTRAMDALGVLVRNADTGTDSPIHVLGQEIAASCPTLFFDEIDTTFAGHAAANPLKRFLNIGYMRGAVIKRQRANAVESWPVFCPKALAGIQNNHLPYSLLSRCITIEMQPRTRELERFNKFHLRRDPQRVELIDRVAAFSERFVLDIANQRPEPLKALDDRQNEIVEPLLQIAGVLGREQELRDALVRVFRSGGTSEVTQEQALLGRIRSAFEFQGLRGQPSDRIHSEVLCAYLGPMYTPRQLGVLLAEMGFVRTHPEVMRIDTEVKRGYAREDFEPLFARWLDPEPRLHVVTDDEKGNES